MPQKQYQRVVCISWRKYWLWRNFSTTTACHMGCQDEMTWRKTKWMANVLTQWGQRQTPAVVIWPLKCNLHVLKSVVFAVCIEQSVTIDSFQFAHYGTMIKMDFCQLYLLQQEHCSFCNRAWYTKMPNNCFFQVFHQLNWERGRKNMAPLFPWDFVYTLTRFLEFFLGNNRWDDGLNGKTSVEWGCSFLTQVRMYRISIISTENFKTGRQGWRTIPSIKISPLPN